MCHDEQNIHTKDSGRRFASAALMSPTREVSETVRSNASILVNHRHNACNTYIPVQKHKKTSSGQASLHVYTGFCTRQCNNYNLLSKVTLQGVVYLRDCKSCRNCMCSRACNMFLHAHLLCDASKAATWRSATASMSRASLAGPDDFRNVCPGEISHVLLEC